LRGESKNAYLGLANKIASAMQILRIRNRAFERFGDVYGPVIDHDHFLGRSAFDVPRKKACPGAVIVSKRGALFVMEVAVPGFAKEDLTVTIADDILVIRGVKKHREEYPETDLIVEEFEMDSFERKFTISPKISREKIEAHYQDGILRLTFIDVPEEEEKNTQFVVIT
jgi:HSP20 family protein